MKSFDEVRCALKDAGIDDCDCSVDARELMRFAGEDEKTLEDALKRRIGGEPLQYIIGEWDFYGLTFKVGTGVLIPRPETELLTGTALKYLAENFDDEPEDEMDNIYRIVYGKDSAEKTRKTPLVLDLCAGSGCVGISIAKNFPNSKVFEVEKSHEAFEYLKQNIALNKVKNVTPFLDDVLCGCKHMVESSKFFFDLIVSNPPYIRTAEIPTLQREVRYEPDLALDGGEDGLVFYRRIAERWLPRVKSGGLALFECGEDQADEIMRIFSKKVPTSCGEVFKLTDFSGIYRAVGVKIL